MKPGTYATFYLHIISIKTPEEYKAELEEKKKEAEAKAAKAVQEDDSKLQAYFAEHKIKAQKTTSGLYYTIQKEGTGPQIHAGQNVAIMYTGKTLDGTIFDTNRDSSKHHTDPLKFVAGQHKMIPGMDEGVMLMKNGSKATLYLPSPIAYGQRSPSPAIPANSILIFDVEVTEVK
jgi:FKBP-type peptidyl-prolyl cis-trans isomerase FkpA